MARIVNVVGDEIVAELLDNDDAVLFGRVKAGGVQSEHKNSVMVSDKRVSGQHCRVYSSGGQFYVDDLSRNGTIVNDQVLGNGNSRKLASRDCIKLLPDCADFNYRIIFDNGPDQDGKDDGDDDTEKANADATVALCRSSSSSASARASMTRKRQRSSDTVEKDSKKQRKNDNDDDDDDDEEEEELTCGICSELFYKAVSLIPCLHSFCQGCYSQWMAKSSQCPNCRSEVLAMRSNFTVNNLVSKYVKRNPSKWRTAEVMAELDALDKITPAMLNASVDVARHKSFDPYDNDDDDDDDHDEYDGDGDDDDDDDDDMQFLGFGGAGLHVHGVGQPLLFTVQCAQCTTPGADGFQCSATSYHLRCTYCDQYFPDRRQTPAGAHQQCRLCHRAVCSACRDEHVKPLAEWHINSLDELPPPLARSANPFECTVIVDWLASQNRSVDDMYHEILTLIGDNTLHYSVQIAPAMDACLLCAKRVLAGMLLPFRQRIPDEQLEEAIRNRPSCHWGRGCRTQHHSLSHASRYNHACEQTRFE
jgi:Cysteine rich domain with multizinc binding regions/FHA domain/Zinc finger, C3HC4 type (RING finger)